MKIQRLYEKTLKKLRTIDYPKDKVNFYLLDDSSDSELADMLRKVAERNGFRFIHRNERKGFKAGALNNFLRQSDEELIAIFDADEYLVNKDFLKDLVPAFDDPEVGYIQTEKRYANSNFFANSINLFNSFFFSFIQPSRASRNTSIFAGSCGINKRKQLIMLADFRNM